MEILCGGMCRTNDELGIVEVKPTADPKDRTPLLFQLQMLMKQLPDVIVQGIHTVERAIVNKAKDKCDLSLSFISFSQSASARCCPA